MLFDEPELFLSHWHSVTEAIVDPYLQALLLKHSLNELEMSR
jgi:hypothetical protein